MSQIHKAQCLSFTPRPRGVNFTAIDSSSTSCSCWGPQTWNREELGLASDAFTDLKKGQRCRIYEVASHMTADQYSSSQLISHGFFMPCPPCFSDSDKQPVIKLDDKLIVSHILNMLTFQHNIALVTGQWICKWMDNFTHQDVSYTIITIKWKHSWFIPSHGLNIRADISNFLKK